MVYKGKDLDAYIKGLHQIIKAAPVTLRYKMILRAVLNKSSGFTRYQHYNAMLAFLSNDLNRYSDDADMVEVPDSFERYVKDLAKGTLSKSLLMLPWYVEGQLDEARIEDRFLVVAFSYCFLPLFFLSRSSFRLRLPYDWGKITDKCLLLQRVMRSLNEKNMETKLKNFEKKRSLLRVLVKGLEAYD